ncbi:MAG: cation-translocating P-type ATPase, partial [Anaerolineae bacterium]
ETLGSATAIASDKTGTLTLNRMVAVRLWIHHAELDVTGQGYQPEGEFQRNGKPYDVQPDIEAASLLWAAALANDAELEPAGEVNGKTSYRMVGDPTEGALVVAAAKAGTWRQELERAYPRVAEIPFDAERKRMATVHELRDVNEDDPSPFLTGETGYVVAVKGAPDLVLEHCTRLLHRKGPAPMTDEERQKIRDANARLASQALRVLAVAYRRLDHLPPAEEITVDHIEKDLIFIGMIGLIDPARPEVKPAIAKARHAGIRTVMVTGDYPDTARAIAGQIGLLRDGKVGGKVFTGAQLDEMDTQALANEIDRTDVFARVSPEHKVRIVEAFRARGHVVAMTGDGVNDAPALKRANLGVSMGITGTDVSKETADMVLTDDNYVSIVGAVEQGRIIYSNIRKFVFYLLSCNVAEIAIIFIAALAGWATPLTPIQLLWLNLLTDGAPALALGMEKGDPDTMDQPPRPPKEPIINRIMVIRIAIMTVALTAVVLTAYLIGLRSDHPDAIRLAETMAFVTLAFAELPIAYTTRSERYALLRLGVFSNVWMQRAVGLSIILILAVIYIPFLNAPFNTVPLSPAHWAAIVPLALIPALIAEVTKLVLRRAETKRLAALDASGR